MFKVGDEVRIRSNGAKGVVGYAEDGYFCVDLDNGAEMDFEDESLLQLAVDYDAEWNLKSAILVRRGAVNLSMSKADPADFKGLPYIPHKGDRRLATEVIRIINKIAPAILDAAAVNNDNFHQLDDVEKVKHIAKITGTPMIVFMGAGEMGDRGMMEAVIRKTLLVNITERTDLVCDMILGRVKREIAGYEKEHQDG